jgi:hypothetical protein
VALLINKPKRVVINTTATLTLNRAELAGYFAGNPRFADTANWDKVYFYYTDASGKQNINVFFSSNKNTALLSPSFFVRQSKWRLQKVIVRDYERGLITLNRKKYLSALSECDIVIAVANRTPSDIFISNTSVLENQTFVGNLTATDPDIEDPLVYSVVTGFGDAADFRIIGENALHFVAAPNFEVKNQYSVKIRVTDSSDVFYEEVFTINVVDVNEVPSNITLSSNTINENSAINTVISALSVTDVDAGDSHTFSIVSGDTSAFNVNGNQLRSSVVFDYENKASYSVTIRATDNGGLTFDKLFNISVLSVNETPTGIAISNGSINELNNINDVVGVFTTTDPDGDTSFTYSLVGGDTSAFNINENQLRASQVFNLESKSSYTVTVRSTDAGGLTYDKSFTININNVSEAPTEITISNSSIGEYNSVNAVIGTLSATKPTSQGVSYSLVGGDVASFNINGDQLRASVSFNYSTKSLYSVTVRATSGGEYFDKSFAVSIIDYSYIYNGKIISATTGSGVSGALVNFYSYLNGPLLATATTNSTGNYSAGLEASGSYWVTVSASGYQTWGGTLNTGTTANITVSTVLSNAVARAVLEWGSTPNDLDFHLRGISTNSYPYTVYYSNKETTGEASLDRDDTSAYGPETITIQRFNPGTYTLYVHNFNANAMGLGNSNAKVTLFMANGSQQTFNVPYAQGIWWTVCTINGSTGVASAVNTMHSTKPF